MGSNPLLVGVLRGTEISSVERLLKAEGSEDLIVIACIAYGAEGKPQFFVNYFWQKERLSLRRFFCKERRRTQKILHGTDYLAVSLRKPATVRASLQKEKGVNPKHHQKIRSSSYLGNGISSRLMR